MIVHNQSETISAIEHTLDEKTKFMIVTTLIDYNIVNDFPGFVSQIFLMSFMIL